MKTRNFDIFEAFALTSEEMICVRGGGDPEPEPPKPPIKL